MQDNAQIQELGAPDAPNSPKSATDHLLDFAGQALEEAGAEIVGRVIENVLVAAPKKVAETAVCAVIDGLGSI